jgi:dihydroflavonol-4-reductase
VHKTILITGISGFIAKHVAREFLEHGYKVRGTVRDSGRADEVRNILAQFVDVSELGFVEADLNSDTGWEEAVKGCDYIAHVASPFPLSQPKNENDLIRPAVDGTLRVLTAARNAGASRVVMTSSTAAIVSGHPRDKTHFSEQDWTILDSPETTAYAKSKTMAEKSAREFIKNEAPDVYFSTINPGLVWGPALDARIGSSLDIIRMMLNGKYPGCPKFYLSVVDVRDVARLHRLAMETDQPSGGRYIAVSETEPMVKYAREIRAELGQLARKVPPRELPNFLVKVAGIFDPAVRAALPELDWAREIDASASRKALGLEFTSGKEAAIAAARSLIEHGCVPG